MITHFFYKDNRFSLWFYKISYKDTIHSQRKVFQTSGSYAGARYTGKIFSIIQTCLINKCRKILRVWNNLNRKPIEELLPYSKEIRKMKWWVELSQVFLADYIKNTIPFIMLNRISEKKVWHDCIKPLLFLWQIRTILIQNASTLLFFESILFSM